MIHIYNQRLASELLALLEYPFLRGSRSLGQPLRNKVLISLALLEEYIDSISDKCLLGPGSRCGKTLVSYFKWAPILASCQLPIPPMREPYIWGQLLTTWGEGEHAVTGEETVQGGQEYRARW